MEYNGIVIEFVESKEKFVAKVDGYLIESNDLKKVRKEIDKLKGEIGVAFLIHHGIEEVNVIRKDKNGCHYYVKGKGDDRAKKAWDGYLYAKSEKNMELAKEIEAIDKEIRSLSDKRGKIVCKLEHFKE
jgi:uncharacterized protein YeeX (DUF496 family)